MVARDPNAAKWAAGMPGGPDNPLGARALYLYEGDQDTIYRIHGTPEPWTIGLDVSSGCIRMNNDDIVDLHSRVKVGRKGHRADAGGGALQGSLTLMKTTLFRVSAHLRPRRAAGLALALAASLASGCMSGAPGAGQRPQHRADRASRPAAGLRERGGDARWAWTAASVLPISSSQLDAQSYQVVLDASGARANCVVDAAGNVVSVKKA